MSDHTWNIEKKIPVPNRAWATKYPWGQMEGGDSVLFPWDERTHRKTQGSMQQSAARWLERHGRTDLYATARPEKGGVRVWFVERVPTP